MDRPTRVRYRVVALTVALAMVTYLDRVCISKLAPDIMRDLNLSKIQMGYVFSSFTLAYAFFEIPTAWWADREGTRRVLTRIVIWWSSFTIATAAAYNYATLLLVRFLFGAGEAGAWPCVARTFSRWIPARERGTIQGIFFAGAHLAGGLTPLRRRRPAAVPAVARDLRLLRSGGVPVGSGLVCLVPQRPVGTSRGQCRGARAHRRGASPGQPSRRGLGLLGTADGSEHRGVVRHVRLEQLDVVLLHHLAADLPAGAARLRRDHIGVLRGPAAARERPQRSVRRAWSRTSSPRATGCASDAAGWGPSRI